jgi:hypothetical protein
MGICFVHRRRNYIEMLHTAEESRHHGGDPLTATIWIHSLRYRDKILLITCTLILEEGCEDHR